MIEPIISRRLDGSILTRSYFNNLQQSHRINGPAYTSYHENGMEASELYFFCGKLHRINGPAEVYYSPNGVKTCQTYRINHLLHREDGPAVFFL